MTAVAHPHRTLPRPERAYKGYTEAELIFLQRWYGLLSRRLISTIMHRSENAIALMATQMELTNGRNEPAFIQQRRAELAQLRRETEREVA